MEKRYFSIIAAGILSTAGAFAQNFNPQVLVTNDYEGKVLEVSKKEIGMAVPDSLLKFNYNVDYSVFANPYNGSYEFHPYLVEMRPDASLYDGKVFYANAGAGYSLHPEADVVWTPLRSERFYFGVYDTFRGYFGNYRNMGVRDKRIQEDGDARVGRYMINRLGVEGTYIAAKSIFSFDLGYKLMNSADSLNSHLLNGGDLALRLRSNPLLDNRFFYDFTLAGDGMSDKVKSFTGNPDNISSDATVLDLDGKLYGNFGFKQGIHHALKFDLSAEFAHTQSDYFTQVVVDNIFGISVTPKYVFDYDRFKCSLGVKVSFVTSGHNQIAYPDIYIDYFPGRKRVDLYAKITGGDNIQTFSDYLSINPFVSNLYGFTRPGVESERFNASAGVKGSLGRHFQYDAFAGYAMKMNGLCEYINADDFLLGDVRRYDFNVFRAGLDLLWKSERLDVGGEFRYTGEDAYKKGYIVVETAPFRGKLKATYNINERIYFGLDLEGQSDRRVRYAEASASTEASIPWNLDLGAHAEFKVNRWLSAWAKGGNFLGQPIQKYLLHAEQGPYFVAGISVRL